MCETNDVVPPITIPMYIPGVAYTPDPTSLERLSGGLSAVGGVWNTGNPKQLRYSFRTMAGSVVHAAGAYQIYSPLVL